ncbi:MAG TPA: hypothetical protein VNK04_07740 [Gemmataceae bacterium]|nr:hypothetical protein [Gemmataceae bacterium]
MELQATIKRIDVPQSTVTVVGPKGKEINITVIPGAKVTLEGKPSTLAGLRPGQSVKITHAENKASVVEAT